MAEGSPGPGGMQALAGVLVVSWLTQERGLGQRRADRASEVGRIGPRKNSGKIRYSLFKLGFTL